MRHSLLKTFSLSLAVAALAAVQALPAQVVPTSPVARRVGSPHPVELGTIDGIVADSSLAPVQAAFVSILGTSIRVGTGPNGRFRITKIPVGQYLIIVKRVGFHPTSSVVEVSSSDTLRLSYTIERAPVTVLDPVVVSEHAPLAKLSEFEKRRRLGVGEFMTADQIKEQNPVYPTELIRRFKTVSVSPNRSKATPEYYALSAREGGNPSLGACPMQVFLDEVPLPTPFNLDLLPSPREIVGIEVYAGSSTIPPQYNGPNRGCGVILVWTREN
jgi:Carboxypeptidase regulatory-like domain